ncbi:MAG: hypothetical protein V7675_03485 [Hyphomonas sp.]|uniref:hypothetical protein n=1 Tax=Hyphomonas sp. TaxID=87 RepID=UPI0030026973|tara:strand:+ start:1056 stop:1475 length:420 start_codon:yes stop_codon:yes gene_type:complete
MSFETLDDEQFRQFANDDPGGFMRGLDHAVIDEVQTGNCAGSAKDVAAERTRVPKATDIKPEDLAAAIKATFERRDTPVPTERPPGLSQEFAEAPVKIAQWTAYSEATELCGISLSDVIDEIWTFISEVTRKGTTNSEL